MNFIKSITICSDLFHRYSCQFFRAMLPAEATICADIQHNIRYCIVRQPLADPCFQDGWTGLDAWGPSRTSRTINRRPGRLIDPGRVPWSSWSSPIWGTYIYHIYNIYIYIYTIVITIHTLHHIYTHTHTLIYYIF